VIERFSLPLGDPGDIPQIGRPTGESFHHNQIFG